MIDILHACSLFTALKIKLLAISQLGNEGKLSNCFSMNQLVGQNIILKKRTETSAKRKFQAIVLNLHENRHLFATIVVYHQ